MDSRDSCRVWHEALIEFSGLCSTLRRSYRAGALGCEVVVGENGYPLGSDSSVSISSASRVCWFATLSGLLAYRHVRAHRRLWSHLSCLVFLAWHVAPVLYRSRGSLLILVV